MELLTINLIVIYNINVLVLNVYPTLINDLSNNTIIR